MIFSATPLAAVNYAPVDGTFGRIIFFFNDLDTII
jgi:hypothetical protein